jgi:hypothetical protein
MGERDASPERSKPKIGKYQYLLLTDPGLEYTDKDILKPFTSECGTLRWNFCMEGQYTLSTDLDEDKVVAIYKEQQKYWKKKCLDSSAWIFAKILA